MRTRPLLLQGNAQFSALERITLLHISIHQVVEKKELCSKETKPLMQLSHVIVPFCLISVAINVVTKVVYLCSLSTTSMSTPYFIYIALIVAFHLYGIFPLIYSLYTLWEKWFQTISIFSQWPLAVSVSCSLNGVGQGKFKSNPENGCHQAITVSKSFRGFRAD